MDVRDGVGFRPPWRKPWNPVMLIDNKIEWLLFAIPTPGQEHGLAAASSADDLYSIDYVLRLAVREFVGEPKYFVPAFPQAFQVRQADTFGPAGFRIHRVAPVKH